MSDLPPYYFRVRENGAFVFRVDTENRQRRIDMDQIAVINIRNGQVKAHGDRELSDEDMKVFLEDKLSPIEMPRNFVIKNEPLPKTAVGKLSRKDLLEREGIKRG